MTSENSQPIRFVKVKRVDQSDSGRFRRTKHKKCGRAMLSAKQQLLRSRFKTRIIFIKEAFISPHCHYFLLLSLLSVRLWLFVLFYRWHFEFRVPRSKRLQQTRTGNPSTSEILRSGRGTAYCAWKPQRICHRRTQVERNNCCAVCCMVVWTS